MDILIADAVRDDVNVAFILDYRLLAEPDALR